MEKMHSPKYKALEDSASKCVVTEALIGGLPVEQDRTRHVLLAANVPS